MERYFNIKFIIILLFAFLPSKAWLQEARLAAQYYQNGEYEKAATLYEKLYSSNGNNDYYFSKFTECLIELKEFDKVEKLIKNQIGLQPEALQYYVMLGNVYERDFKDDEAKKMYREAINKVEPNTSSVIKLGSSFVNLGKYDLAIETYEKGIELLNDDKAFARSLADLYRRTGDKDNMIKYYLSGINNYASNLSNLKTTFERTFEEDDYARLQSQLYSKIQENPDEVAYVELIEWTFIHEKEFDKALRQAKALDRRLDENGQRVYEIGNVAFNHGDYPTAIEAYEYITTQKGINSSYYLFSKTMLLKSKKEQLLQDSHYTTEQLKSIEQEYESFLQDYGYNSRSADLIIEYANFEAFYLNNYDKAIGLLKSVVEMQSASKASRALAKLDLGDYYLIQGDRWESNLLYAQVDKDFNEGVLGEQARYKNALLSYFMGDFEWAQEQFDILKSATTKLISNDAIDKSVFILDNLGLDTTAVPLQLYATSELLVFQNKYEEAFQTLDSIEINFPEHGLEDDVLYLKAQIYKRERQYDKAIEQYQVILDKFKEEIRADNALFEMAELYENVLEDKEKAKSLYEQLFLEFDNSTYAVEARKRFRILRGDEI